MPKITNHELVNGLFVATEQDQIDWQPTAKPQEFAASFGGKWTLLISEGFTGVPLQFTRQLYVKDSEGTTMVRIADSDDSRIPELYEMARRYALKINEALADLLNEIKKPQK
jgi:hypothetical protein